MTVLSLVVRFFASDVARWTGGDLVGPDVTIDGLSFDSRSIESGCLFAAIVAERDGHDYVNEARRAGAVAALVSRQIDNDSGTSIVVADTLHALGDIARQVRVELLGETTVIGITGSVGKTSVKDLTVAAVGDEGTWASPRSYNNDQGLPFTVLNAPAATRHLVLEMGMRGLGEIRRLCDIAQPDIGVVTRVGEAHTERLGGLDGVALAKGELVESLSNKGVAVLNADDPRVEAMSARTSAAVIRFGSQGDVRIERLTFDDRMRAHGIVHSPWGSGVLRLEMPGSHMVSNALAAVAVAGVLAGSVEGALVRLSRARVTEQRMTIHEYPNGLVVVDDTYNANPTSMEAALRTVAEMAADDRCAVLGPMAEVANAEEAHLRIAGLATELGVGLIAIGTDRYGVPPVSDPADIVLKRHMAGNGTTIVLVKASRSAGLERVVADLDGRSLMQS